MSGGNRIRKLVFLHSCSSRMVPHANGTRRKVKAAHKIFQISKLEGFIGSKALLEQADGPPQSSEQFCGSASRTEGCWGVRNNTRLRDS